KYSSEGIPLIVLAGKQYGAGSSRDWAAKAPRLLGVRAVIAENFERIHRSNLVAMGVIPLQFEDGKGVKQLGLTGGEIFDIAGFQKMASPKEWVDVLARGPSGEIRFRALARIDNATEMQYLQEDGVLPYVFARLHKSGH
ncbi:MAG: aconitate hydratase, partial [Thaumarchaeota archaeon]|nr:aconitate hydratase [Nitrososphaerota archaeon]